MTKLRIVYIQGAYRDRVRFSGRDLIFSVRTVYFTGPFNSWPCHSNLCCKKHWTENIGLDGINVMLETTFKTVFLGYFLIFWPKIFENEPQFGNEMLIHLRLSLKRLSDKGVKSDWILARPTKNIKKSSWNACSLSVLNWFCVDIESIDHTQCQHRSFQGQCSGHKSWFDQ